jgi:hypothetical protein
MVAVVVPPATVTVLPSGAEVTVYKVMELLAGTVDGVQLTVAWALPAVARTCTGGSGVSERVLTLAANSEVSRGEDVLVAVAVTI